jgi:periplasmic protein TonB
MRPFVLFLSYLICHFSFFPAQENPSEKAATQAPGVPRISVKGNVMSKKLIHKIIPNYPSEARQMHTDGVVKLRVVIGVDGSVKQAEYLSGPKLLVEATIDAVRQWKYKPTTENGQPVEVETNVETVFSLVQ